MTITTVVWPSRVSHSATEKVLSPSRTAVKFRYSQRSGAGKIGIRGKRTAIVLQSVSSNASGTALLGRLRNLFTPKNQQKRSSEESRKAEMSDPVVVIGSSGRVGRLIVESLAAQGRNVIAATRGESIEGLGSESNHTLGNVQVRGNVDVRDTESLERGLSGAKQVVIASGPSRDSDGGTSEEIDYLGTVAVTRVLAGMLKDKRENEPEETMVKYLAATEIPFERLDDVIMGGQSESGTQIAAVEDESVNDQHATTGAVRWTGKLILEGGGFCGTRAKLSDPISLDGVDCIRLTVRCSQNLRDDCRFKMNIKVEAMVDTPEYTFQAPFSVPKSSEFVTIDIPRQAFVPVKRASVTYQNSSALLQTDSLYQVGFVYSRFEFNGGENPQYSAGEFALDIQSIAFVGKARPDIVLVSSAGVEQNVLLSDDDRRSAIPIIVLNPGGILNYKYLGEEAVRAASASSGLRYCIIRPTGLVQDLNDQPPGTPAPTGASNSTGGDENGASSAAKEPAPPPILAKLELSQGDRLQGRISRAVVAKIATTALSTSASVNKTFEAAESCARNMNKDGRIQSATTVSDIERGLAGLCSDIDRPYRGLLPMPRGVEPAKSDDQSSA